MTQTTTQTTPTPSGVSLPLAPAARRIAPWTILGAIFVLTGLGVLVSGRAWVPDFSITFVSIVLEALPFIALGSLIGGLIEVFVSRERITRLLPRRRLPAMGMAGLMGIALPVCECAVIPVTRRLLRKGVPFSVAVAYLIAGPIVNPIVAASTAVAYAGDWVVVAARLGAGYVVAIAVALVIDRFYPGHTALLDNSAEKAAVWFPSICGHGPPNVHDVDQPEACGHDHAPPPAKTDPLGRRFLHAFDHAADDFIFVGQFLILGAFLAALSQTHVPRDMFLQLAETPALAIGLMMSLAVVLNLCSEADAFVAASFRGMLPVSSQLAFLVLGPMLDLKLLAMYLAFLKKGAVFVKAASMVVFVFVIMWLLATFGGPAFG